MFQEGIRVARRTVVVNALKLIDSAVGGLSFHDAASTLAAHRAPSVVAAAARCDHDRSIICIV
jgi:hypothetical protein